jgi:hypothetical protein
METAKLKKFAQYARRSLIEQVSAKLKLVLAENSAARRESVKAVKKLEEAIEGYGKEQVIERVAYIWFNRFCALRFMDVNRYTRIGVVSPAEGQFQPEILAEAKMGHIDEEMVPNTIQQQVFALLDGKAPSRDPQGEAYRLLVVATCNFWNTAMPFLFQRIDDYTELLMPDDLLSGNSILAYTREAMTPDACEDVEVIGWLYQFYISEKKDEVFDGLKKNKKITPENIPAATQLFTPHWIVRYLVENSLGRLWMLNRPNSRLVERMEYYIRPDTSHQPSAVSNQQETTDNCTLNTDYLRVSSPEEIRICDPACGSGHMLTYAFDLLYAIYEEEGVDPAEIPEKILTNNLYGIEIDERAGELAAFALTMKARAKQRRFFNKGVKPNICVLENITFTHNEHEHILDLKFIEVSNQFAYRNYEIKESPIWKECCKEYKAQHKKDPDIAYFKRIKEGIQPLLNLSLAKRNRESALAPQGRSLKLIDCIDDPAQLTLYFSRSILYSVNSFKHKLNELTEFTNFGSLWRPDEALYQIIDRYINELDITDLLESGTLKKLNQFCSQYDYLSPKYHVVIANPPYMGGKGMNGRLGAWVKNNYPNSKSDLFAMFIERSLDLAQKHGAVAMITMQSWMFLSSFEKLRSQILDEATILSMAHLGARAFDSIGGEVVSTTAFVLENANKPDYRGAYMRLVNGNSEAEKMAMLAKAITQGGKNER